MYLPLERCHESPIARVMLSSKYESWKQAEAVQASFSVIQCLVHNERGDFIYFVDMGWSPLERLGGTRVLRIQ